MTAEFFQSQISRLTTRFGNKAFDKEFITLVWNEVQGLSEQGFKRFIDVCIGSRSVGKPPLLVDFREARLAEEKKRFEADVRGAADFLAGKTKAQRHEHLMKVLSKEFGAVNSVIEALEIAKHRLRIQKANEEGA